MWEISNNIICIDLLKYECSGARRTRNQIGVALSIYLERKEWGNMSKWFEFVSYFFFLLLKTTPLDSQLYSKGNSLATYSSKKDTVSVELCLLHCNLRHISQIVNNHIHMEYKFNK